jgi:hypothetical protein
LIKESPQENGWLDIPGCSKFIGEKAREGIKFSGISIMFSCF